MTNDHLPRWRNDRRRESEAQQSASSSWTSRLNIVSDERRFRHWIVISINEKNNRVENRFHPSTSIAKTKFLRVFSPPRHVDVIEGNLPREVGSLRGSDYNTSEFIHRRDSSAPEVTRRECFPEVGCVRASARVVNFSSGTRWSGWRACNVRV